MHSVDKTYFTSDAICRFLKLRQCSNTIRKTVIRGIFRINSALHPPHGENEIGLIRSNTKTFFLDYRKKNTELRQFFLKFSAKIRYYKKIRISIWTQMVWIDTLIQTVKQQIFFSYFEKFFIKKSRQAFLPVGIFMQYMLYPLTEPPVIPST